MSDFESTLRGSSSWIPGAGGIPESRNSVSSAWRTLGPVEIRLLEIDRRAARDPTENTYEFKLRTYRCYRTAAPSYTALSYTWGHEDATKAISINDEQHFIRPNLYNCLLSLVKHTTWSHIWVDSLCINQRNVRERNAQVSNMATTFHDASIVALWLGSEDDVRGTMATHRNVDLASRGEEDEDAWQWQDHILQLAVMPYWYRRWIVQELVHARRITILCGPHTISPEDFATLLRTSNASGISDTSAMLVMRCLESDTWRRSVASVMHTFRHARCQDPRDRVFALLSLFPPEDRKALGTRFPDYSAPYEAVTERFQKYCRHAKSRDGRQYGERVSNAATEEEEEDLAWLGLIEGIGDDLPPVHIAQLSGRT